MLGPFSQSLYSTVLDEKSDNLLSFPSDVQHYLIWPTSTGLLLYYSNKMRICYTAVCEFQHHCPDFNVPVIPA